MLTKKNKNSISSAFTLAETLLTIGIIGVVAAMTIPSLVKNIRGKILESQLKKSYSIMSQALEQFIEDEQQIPNPTNYTTSYYGKNSFLDIYSKYFKGQAHCLRYECKSLNIMGFDDYIKRIKEYKNYTKNNTINGTGAFTACLDDGIITSNDSMLIVFDMGTCIPDRFILTVDVNGINKKPNALGHDFFVFEINPKTGKLIPSGGIDSYYKSNNCTKNNTYGSNGTGCTYKALTEENYFKNLP